MDIKYRIMYQGRWVLETEGEQFIEGWGPSIEVRVHCADIVQTMKSVARMVIASLEKVNGD